MQPVLDPDRRIVIVGGPRCGKTTHSLQLGIARVRHTDDLIGTYEWSAQSEEVARWFGEPGPWVVEGVTAVRALRKWLAAHPVGRPGRPCDQVLIMVEPKVELNRAQQAVLKAFYTIWREIQADLQSRGVAVELVG